MENNLVKTKKFSFKTFLLIFLIFCVLDIAITYFFYDPSECGYVPKMYQNPLGHKYIDVGDSPEDCLIGGIGGTDGIHTPVSNYFFLGFPALLILKDTGSGIIWYFYPYYLLINLAVLVFLSTACSFLWTKLKTPK